MNGVRKGRESRVETHVPPVSGYKRGISGGRRMSEDDRERAAAVWGIIIAGIVAALFTAAFVILGEHPAR